MSDTEQTTSESEAERKDLRRERRARGQVIGRKLKAMYDDVANEPVPDEFLKLLEDADESSQDQES
jgi:hypothetical protein